MFKLLFVLLLSFVSLQSKAETCPRTEYIVAGAVAGVVVVGGLSVIAVATTPVAMAGAPIAYSVFGLSTVVAANASGIIAASAVGGIVGGMVGNSAATIKCAKAVIS